MGSGSWVPLGAQNWPEDDQQWPEDDSSDTVPTEEPSHDTGDTANAPEQPFRYHTYRISDADAGWMANVCWPETDSDRDSSETRSNPPLYDEWIMEKEENITTSDEETESTDPEDGDGNDRDDDGCEPITETEINKMCLRAIEQIRGEQLLDLPVVNRMLERLSSHDGLEMVLRAEECRKESQGAGEPDFYFNLLQHNLSGGLVSINEDFRFDTEIRQPMLVRYVFSQAATTLAKKIYVLGPPFWALSSAEKAELTGEALDLLDSGSLDRLPKDEDLEMV